MRRGLWDATLVACAFAQQVYLSSGLQLQNGESQYMLHAHQHDVDGNADVINIRRPVIDKRRYRYTTFAENGLKVLAVEDQDAPKAGIAVAVEAGSFYDPESLPGLAHFCEHLLFLGTKKYPDEASFDAFLAKHDGSTNAFTEQERTVYYHEVNHDGFEEAMDRFAQFFISPLFKGELVARELNAVDSEHKKNIPDQGRRMWEVLRSTARKDSVLHRFYTGTRESLHNGDAKTVAALRAYHDANYCGPRTHVVMISNKSLDKQIELARRSFLGVPRGNCKASTDFGSSSTPAFDDNHLGQFLELGTTSTPTLWMMFPLPPTLKLYKQAPMQFIQYMLGYAGPKSLSGSLKKEGLINSLGIQVDETSAATMVFLVFDLTAKGAASRDSVQEVVRATFAYLQTIQSGEAASDAFPGIYSSLLKMSQVSFDYGEAPDSVMDYVSSLAQAMPQYAPQDILTAMNGVIDELGIEPAKRMLAFMADPAHVNIAFAHAGFDESSANEFEPYYSIHYRQDAFSASTLADLRKAHETEGSEKEAVRMPPPLGFVPTALTIRNKTGQHVPERVTGLVAPNLELWWKGAGDFRVPKTQLRMKLGLPLKSSKLDAKHAALRQLHTELVAESLEEVTEDFRSCGLDFGVRAIGTGYAVDVAGYEQHLGSLLTKVLDSLFAKSFSSPSFLRAHSQLVDQLNDTARYAPYQLALDALSSITTNSVFSREEVLAELQQINEQKLQEYLQNFQRQGLRVQILVVGNVDREGAKRLASDIVGGALKKSSAAEDKNSSGLSFLGAEQALESKAIVVRKPVEIRLANPIPGDVNHATVVSYQFGVPDISERVKLLLISRIIEGPIFDSLRTKQQLGYIVSGFVAEHISILEMRVLVQGSKENPDEVIGAIEVELQDISKKLRNMSASDFQQWKTALHGALSQKDQNLAQETDRFWSQIASDLHCFERKKLALEYLSSLASSRDVADTFDELRRANRTVRVKLYSGGVPETEAAPANHERTGLSSHRDWSGGLLLSGASTLDKERLIATAGAVPTYPSRGVCEVHHQP